jgi:hypothetical protein
MQHLKQFSQHNDPKLPNGAGKGVCLPMSAWYLIQAAKGEDYWAWFDEAAQEVYNQGQRTLSDDQYIDQISSSGKLQLVERFNAPTTSLAVNLLQATGGSFRMATMDSGYAFRQAHAIACYMGFKIRILDVSGDGEFEFDSRDEAFGWLSKHVTKPRVPYVAGRVVAYT